MPIGMSTHLGANDLRESLLSIMKDVSPVESNYLVSNLPKGPVATNTYQEWNTFYQARPTTVAPVAEGAVTSYVDLVAESRTGNYTTIVERPVKVTRSMASVATVTGEDEVSKQKERALRNLKSDMEWYTINGLGPTAGLSGIARSFAGIDQCISTNVSAFASGQSFTETILNDMVQRSWDQVEDEYVGNVLLAPVVIKRRVAGFGTNLTRNVQAADKRLTQEVRVYDSEVGPTVMILAHKDVRSAAGTLTAYLINDTCFAHSFLVETGEPHWEDRAKDGDYTVGTYLSEMTLVSYAQRASVKVSGFNTGL